MMCSILTELVHGSLWNLSRSQAHKSAWVLSILCEILEYGKMLNFWYSPDMFCQFVNPVYFPLFTGYSYEAVVILKIPYVTKKCLLAWSLMCFLILWILNCENWHFWELCTFWVSWCYWFIIPWPSNLVCVKRVMTITGRMHACWEMYKYPSWWHCGHEKLFWLYLSAFLSSQCHLILRWSISQRVCVLAILFHDGVIIVIVKWWW